MLRDVAQERGTLPLLAFAMARLWEHRDRERGLLTRRGYEEIGGVAGALAQHAEATLETIGAVRVPIVREILRNLVTADGNAGAPGMGRAPLRLRRPRGEAEEVLDRLVEARLLTSFEAPSEEGSDRTSPRGDHSRVVARVLAAARALARSGRRGCASARSAPAGGTPLGRARAPDRSLVERDRRSRSTSSGERAMPADSLRSSRLSARRWKPRPAAAACQMRLGIGAAFAALLDRTRGRESALDAEPRVGAAGGAADAPHRGTAALCAGTGRGRSEPDTGVRARDRRLGARRYCGDPALRAAPALERAAGVRAERGKQRR